MYASVQCIVIDFNYSCAGKRPLFFTTNHRCVTSEHATAEDIKTLLSSSLLSFLLQIFRLSVAVLPNAFIYLLKVYILHILTSFMQITQLNQINKEESELIPCLYIWWPPNKVYMSRVSRVIYIFTDIFNNRVILSNSISSLKCLYIISSLNQELEKIKN